MKISIAGTLSFIAGLLMILTGVLTALKITPEIAAQGAEVLLGIWRIIAGVAILLFAYIARKNRYYFTAVIILGLFEVLVFIVEKDYSLLTIAPVLAIIAGLVGIVKK